MTVTETEKEKETEIGTEIEIGTETGTENAIGTGIGTETETGTGITAKEIVTEIAKGTVTEIETVIVTGTGTGTATGIMTEIGNDDAIGTERNGQAKIEKSAPAETEIETVGTIEAMTTIAARTAPVTGTKTTVARRRARRSANGSRLIAMYQVAVLKAMRRI